MSVRRRGRTFMVDVKFTDGTSPTGEAVRIRRSAKTYEAAVALERELRATARCAPKRQTLREHQSRNLKTALQLTWEHPTRGWALSKSGKVQRYNARAVLRILGEKRACSSIKTADFDHVAAVLLAQGNSLATVGRKLQSLSRVLYFAWRAGWISRRPHWDRPREGPPREFVFSAELEAQIAAFLRGRDPSGLIADLFLVGIGTGARLSELLALQARDVRVEQNFVRVLGEDRKGTKNGDVRTAVVLPEAAEVLRRLVTDLAPDDLVFRGLKRRRVWVLMREARQHFGYEGERAFCFHATRHTNGTRMAERGVSLFDIMGQLGHRTAATSQRYINIAPTARRTNILNAFAGSGAAS